MFQSKKRELYVCVATILLLSQAIEAASYETGSWKERLYSGLYSWWNKPRTPYPDWAKYAFVGGLGIAAIATAYTLWSQRSQKSKPGEQPTAPRKELTLEQQLRKLDPIMADVYEYLASLQEKQETNYQDLLNELKKNNIISENTPQPLDIACTLVWYPDKAILLQLLKVHKEEGEAGSAFSPVIEALLEAVGLEQYLTKEQIERIAKPSNLLGTNFGIEQQASGKLDLDLDFFLNFYKLSLENSDYPARWIAIQGHSACIKANMEKLQEKVPKQSFFKQLLHMQTKTKITSNLAKISREDRRFETWVKALIKMINEKSP